MSEKPSHLRVVGPNERCRPRYHPPDPQGHKVAFKGKRFWVIELEEGRMFECYDKEIADFLIYDKWLGAPIAWASHAEGGGFTILIIYCGHELKYHADRIEDLGRVAAAEADMIYADDDREWREERRQRRGWYVV